MKRKNLCRLVSAAETVAWGLVGHKCYHLLESINYHSIFTDDSIDNRIFKAVYTGVICLSVPTAVLGVADGISGVATGVYNYLILRSWQKLSRNSETKKGIESSISSMREE